MSFVRKFQGSALTLVQQVLELPLLTASAVLMLACSVSHAAAQVGSNSPTRVSTYAGSVRGSADGFKSEATFSYPSALAFSPDGRIFVTEANVPTFTTAEPGAHRIRVIAPDGMVSTFAGGEEPGYVNGPRLSARFRGPTGLVFDRKGNIFIADRINHLIRKIDADGIVSTFAGSAPGYRDGVGREAMFNSPIGLCIDKEDNLYVGDFENIVIRKVTPEGAVSTYAGIAHNRGSQDGFRTAATFNSPHWPTISETGEIFIADWLNGLIRRISVDGIVSTFASGWTFIESVTVDSTGDVYATVPPGSGAHRFLKFDSSGSLEWSLDNPVGYQDGPVAVAQFEHFSPPLFLPGGHMLMTDGHRIRLIEVEQTSCPAAPAGMIGWWRGDGDARDATGAHHGAIAGGVSFPSGHVGIGFGFDGASGRVSVENAPDLNFGPGVDFSIEAWIRIPTGSPKESMSVFDKRVAPDIVDGVPFGGAVGYTLFVQNGALGFQMAQAPLRAFGHSDFLSSGPELRDGRFHHVAVTVQRSNATGGKLFVDGQVVLTFDPTVQPGDLSNPAPVRIGNHPSPGWNGFFDGIIDEAALYRRALSQSEIQGIYLAGSAGKCAVPGSVSSQNDLRTDWSDAANPNGPWTFLAGDRVLPRVEDWQLDVFQPPQSGWGFGSTIPFWFRSSAAQKLGEDWQLGDIIVHTHVPGGINGPNNGAARLEWRSPGDGTIDLSGGLWDAREYPDLSGGLRGNHWNLYVRDELVTTGVVRGGDPFHRGNPFLLENGSGGPSAIKGIPVSLGEVVRLEFIPTGTVGNYVGLNLSVAFTGQTSNVPRMAVVFTIAGTGAPGYQNGPASFALFNAPNGGSEAIDRTWFHADTFNHVIRQLDLRTGKVSTWAGSGTPGHQDGPAPSAQFHSPLATFVDRFGTLFVADTGNNRIRQISPEFPFQVSTYAGDGSRGYANGPAVAARFDFPNDITGDSQGNLFVSEFNNHTVRRISPDGMVSTFVGSGTAGFDDGIGVAAGLNQPAGLAIDKDDNLYITEWGSHRIRKATPSGHVTTLAGSVFPGLVNGRGVGARFVRPDGIALDPWDGVLYVTENGNHAVRRITLDGVVTTVAGTGSAGLIDGLGTFAQFNGPGGIGFSARGSLIVADTGNHRIRQIQFMSPPRVVIRTKSTGIRVGNPLELSAQVSGIGPFLFSWEHDGHPIQIGTNSTFRLGSAGFTNAGVYTVTVSNAAGSGQSAPVPVEILRPLEFVRSLPVYYAPGAKMTVRLSTTAVPGGAAHAYAIEESPPAHWQISEVSEGGFYDASTHKVKFGPYLDLQPRVLSYVATPPAGESGPRRFQGVISADGYQVDIGGNTQVLPGPLHPADSSPPDERLSINELTAYVASWRKGQPWTIPPNPIPIEYVTRAGVLWRNGENYRFDPNAGPAPLWWVSRLTAGPSPRAITLERQTPPGLNSATRILPGAYVYAEPFLLRVSVRPASGVAAYAVEEYLPPGLNVQTVGSSGEFDAQSQTVRWGPYFDDQARDLEALVVMSATGGSASFRGVASFDGTNVVTGGAEVVKGAAQLQYVRFINGEFEVKVEGEDGEPFLIQTSSDLRTWTDLSVVIRQGGSLRFSDSDSSRTITRFYRALRQDR